MDKMQTLWVRACKSADPTTRLRSVYRRFYLKQTTKATVDNALVNILSQIVQKNCEINLLDILDKVNPQSTMNKLCSPNATFPELALGCIVSIIRYSNKENFGNDFKWPTRFKTENV